MASKVEYLFKAGFDAGFNKKLILES